MSGVVQLQALVSEEERTGRRRTTKRTPYQIEEWFISVENHRNKGGPSKWDDQTP
ncbi:hypothetical protein RUM43_012008, partial [Polyplax serrata]